MARIDTNKASRQNRLRKALAGMKKHLQRITTLTIAQVVYPVSELEALIQKDIDISDTTDRSKATWQADVQAERGSHKNADPLLRALKQYVFLTWGDSKESSSTLEDFGYSPRKPRTTKPGTQVTAAAKAKATRAARHTMGSKQRARIKGHPPALDPRSSAATSAAPAGAATG